MSFMFSASYVISYILVKSVK